MLQAVRHFILWCNPDSQTEHPHTELNALVFTISGIRNSRRYCEKTGRRLSAGSIGKGSDIFHSSILWLLNVGSKGTDIKEALRNSSVAKFSVIPSEAREELSLSVKVRYPAENLLSNTDNLLSNTALWNKMYQRVANEESKLKIIPENYINLIYTYISTV